MMDGLSLIDFIIYINLKNAGDMGRERDRRTWSQHVLHLVTVQLEAAQGGV